MTKHNVAPTSTATVARPITLVQLTDPHLFADKKNRLLNVNTFDSLQGVLQQVVEAHDSLDLLLVTGDITQDGSQAAYERFREMVGQVAAPLACLPGNHDDHSAIRKVLQSEMDPVLDLGNWRLVLLDSTVPGSNSGMLSDDQIELLRTSAEQAGDKHVLVALHHNPVAVGSPWLDTMMVANAERLFETLEGLPQVKAVIWGHVHQEYDVVHNFPGLPNHRLRLLATPSTCVQFSRNSTQFSLDSAPPGYRRLILHPDGQLQTDVIRVCGLGLEPDANSGGY